MNGMVELRGVSKWYGTHARAGRRRPALGRGVTGLLGPNGAGKTTLLRIVATSIAPDGGEVRLLGRDPLAAHGELTEVRRSLGYLPQELGFPGDMTVFGFVDYIAVLKEWNDQRARGPEEVRRVLEPRRPRGASRPSGSASSPAASAAGSALAQSLLGDPRILRPRRADHRPRPDPAGRPAPYPRDDRGPGRGAALHPPDRGRRRPLRARRRARRWRGPLRRLGRSTWSPRPPARCGWWTTSARPSTPASPAGAPARGGTAVVGGPPPPGVGSCRAHARGRLPPDARRPGSRRAALATA